MLDKYYIFGMTQQTQLSALQIHCASSPAGLIVNAVVGSAIITTENKILVAIIVRLLL